MEHHFDIIAVSETKLDNNISNHLISLSGYHDPFRRDRNRHGGGVCIYVNELLPTKRRPDLESLSVESVWVEIVCNHRKTLIGCYYRPPGQNNMQAEMFINNFQDTLLNITQERYHRLIIMGDFNDRCTSWNSIHVNSELKNNLVDMLQASGLTQIVDEPTFSTDHSDNILDLIITDLPGYVTSKGTLDKIADHAIPYCYFSERSPKHHCYQREIWRYNLGDYDSLRQHLSNASLSAIVTSIPDINQAVCRWTEMLLDSAKLYIPHSVITVRPKDKPWINSNIKRLLRKRNRLYRRWKRTKQDQHRDIYTSARTESKIAINKAKEVYSEQLITKLQDTATSPKEYWKLNRRLMGRERSDTASPLLLNGQSVTDSELKANAFCNYFASQSVAPQIPPDYTYPTLPMMDIPQLDTINLSIEEISTALLTLNPNKANGPDMLSNRLLKEVHREIAPSLCSLFNRSISTHIFPEDWKLANVIPVYKKKDPNNVENYRPVSLLSNVGKLMERVVFNHLYKHCMDNKILTPHNSGFKKGDSTINQLMHLIHNIYQSLDNDEDICAVFLDASRAFDRIWHDGLLYKLRHIGINGDILAWIKSYLEHRKIKVNLQGATSDTLHITAGVPQGSILGPLLFLIYINDIVDNLYSYPFLYADDTAIIMPIDCENPATSFSLINKDLEQLHKWAEQWYMVYNPDKTVYMIISNKRNRTNYPTPVMNNIFLTEVTTHKHLGMKLTNNMSWEPHIDSKINEANKIIGTMWSLNRFIPRRSLEDVYLTFVRPIIEYGCTLYDNCSVYLKKRLENTQRRAALACTRAYSHTQHDILLSEVGWERLDTRREYLKLCTFYKIVNNLSPQYLHILLPPIRNTTYNLRRNMIPAIPTRLTQFTNSFFPKTITKWNALDEYIQQKRTLGSFKAALRKQKYHNRRSKLKSHGYGSGQINHARLRMGLSGLNYHRYTYHFITNFTCKNCTENQREDSCHYLFHCPRFKAHRDKMFDKLADVPNLDIDLSNIDDDILLKGSQNPNVNNELIFAIVQQYIVDTKRFI